MAKIIVTRDQQVLQEIELDRQRTSLGRHPGNDIVIAHAAVSGQHAAFYRDQREIFLEDLDSKNGTFVNGQRIARRLLEDGDRIVIAKFTIDYVADSTATPVNAIIEVTSGPNAGKRLMLTKVVSTLGSPGQQVLAITRRGNDYFIHHVEGHLPAMVNGIAAAAAPRRLADGDRIDLSSTSIVFHLASA